MRNQIIERKDFIRDDKTNALINVDLKSYNRHLEEKNRSQRINSMEREMSEMKLMLREILDRIENDGN